jgi:hypothetical protein
MTGCFGKFALTRKLYGFNDSIGNKFLKTFVFWGLIIIPACQMCATADFVIFNLLEFWTGSNLIGQSDVQHEIRDDGTVQFRSPTGVYTLVPTSEDSFDLYRGGSVIASASLANDGGLNLRTERGFAHINAPAVTPSPQQLAAQ